MHPLIDVSTLQAHLHDPHWLVADCRHDLTDPHAGRQAYAEGHIPGAVFLHLDEDLSGPLRDDHGVFRGRHPLPDREAFARRLGALGVTAETVLVAYDAADGMFASRLWWLALWLGHEKAAILDGGLAAWRAAGYAVTREPPAPRPATSFELRAPRAGTVDAATLLAQLGTGRYRVIDARGAERYRGDVEPLDAKAGHIPGAVNRPYKQNVREDGHFRTARELRDAFGALLGDTPPAQVVHQCGSGVSACHNLVAMSIAGFPGALLYPGSWSEWSADPARPVATGALP